MYLEQPTYKTFLTDIKQHFSNARPENFPAVNDYRNPIISEAMKVLGFVNKFRRGIYRVKDELKANGNPEPIFDFSLLTALNVNVRISDKFVLSKTYELDKSQLDPQLNPQLDPQLNFVNKSIMNKILKFCFTPHSATEISQSFLIKDKSYFRKKYIIPLMESGLLEMTIPNKPNSRMQKYKTTLKGKRSLEI